MSFEAMTGIRNYQEIQEFLESANIQPETRTGLFHIIRLEDHIRSIRKEMPPYRYRFFEITYTSGFDADCHLNDLRFNQREDNLLFVSPGQINSWSIKHPAGPVKGFMMFFKPELLGAGRLSCEVYRAFPFFNLNIQPVCYLSDEQSTLFIDLYERIYREYSEYRDGSLDIITSYLTILLNEARRRLQPGFRKNGRNSRAEEITFQFENLIKSRLHEKKSVKEYAEELYISPSYLREAVKKSTGKPAYSLIQEYIVLEAKSLLLQTSHSIKQVALELGYDDASNFVKFFKNQTGITPLAFRENPQILP